MQASDAQGSTQQLCSMGVCRAVAGLVPGAGWVMAMALAAGWSWQSGSRHSSLEQPAAEDQAKWVDEVK